MSCWELECANLRIVLEGKEVVSISSLFKLFISFGVIVVES